MTDEPKATVTLQTKQRAGIKRPVIHILTPDGRVTEFKDRAIVVPAHGDGDDGVYALLVNGKGEPFYTPDGKPAFVPVPVVGLDMLPDPDKMLSWREIAQRAGVSLSTAKRMSESGELPKPQKRREGGRKVGARQGDVDAALKRGK